ncbi:Peptide chain release factor 1, mitochondrial, partial [Coemansia spiralis]
MRRALQLCVRTRRYATAAARPKPTLPAGSELAGKSHLTVPIHEKLRILQTKHSELSQQLSGDVSVLEREELARLSKELSDTGRVAEPYTRLLQLYSELVELQQLMGDEDATLRDFAQEERDLALTGVAKCEREIIGALLPKDSAEDAGAILEIRAGTGGDEASLFCGCLLRMYERFAQLRRW